MKHNLFWALILTSLFCFAVSHCFSLPLPSHERTKTRKSGATVPRSIILIIDYSPSQFAYIKDSIEAAKVLVDKLKPRDRMAVVTDLESRRASIFRSI